MGASWKYLDLDAKDVLLCRMVTVSPMGPHSTSMAFTGLSKMGATWDSLPADAKNSLQDSFPMPSQASEQVVSNIIHSYGSMGALYARDLSPETKDRLTASFVSVAPAFTVQGLSNTLHGLSKMGFRMESWPDVLLRSFESALFGNRPSSIRHMKDQGVSNTVWSLGQCGALWTVTKTKTDDLNDARGVTTKGRLSSEMCLQLSRSIASNAPQMTEQGVSNALLGLAKVTHPILSYPVLTCLSLSFLTLPCCVVYCHVSFCPSNLTFLSHIYDIYFFLSVVSHLIPVHLSFSYLSLFYLILSTVSCPSLSSPFVFYLVLFVRCISSVLSNEILILFFVVLSCLLPCYPALSYFILRYLILADQRSMVTVPRIIYSDSPPDLNTHSCLVLSCPFFPCLVLSCFIILRWEPNGAL